MIQAFYTSSSGMIAQQKNMDIISNNISNLNTPGYRVQRGEFKELLYNEKQNLDKKTQLPVGHGTMITNISTVPLPDSVNPYGLSVVGNGYFTVQDNSGGRYYTKNGDFKLLEENGKYYLATKKNEFVLDKNGNNIELPNKPDMLVISNGVIYPNGNNGELGISPMLSQFDNSNALDQIEKDKFLETQQSGVAVLSQDARVGVSYLDELSLMSMANQAVEMTRMIQTQMAYQVNSKAMQIADQMESMANRLRG